MCGLNDSFTDFFQSKDILQNEIDLYKEAKDNFPFNNSINDDDNRTIGQIPQQNMISNNPNNANPLDVQINQQDKAHMENTDIVNNFNNYDIETNKPKNDIVEKEPEPKDKNNLFKITYSVVRKESSKYMNITGKSEDLSNININRNESINNKSSIALNINIPEIINQNTFQYFIDTTRIINKNYENMVENKKKKTVLYNDFEKMINKKLKDVLGDYNIEWPTDIFKKEGIQENITISGYLKKLTDKIEKKNFKRKITKPKINQLYRIIDKLINEKNDNINQENKIDSIQKLDDKLLNKNLFNEDSDVICSFNNEISGNGKGNENIFRKISKDRNSTACESNLKSNYIDIDNSKNKKNKKKIREDHIINIIKDTIIELFILLFNKANKSYKLKSAGDKKKNDEERIEEEDNESIKEYNKEDIIEDDFIGKEDFYKPIYLNEQEKNLLELIEDIEENSYENEEEFDYEMEIEYDDKENEKINRIEEDIKNEQKIKEEKDEKEITINISKINKNNTEEDSKFINDNFENIINEAKKKQHLENLEESEEAKNLIKKTKSAFLNDILSDNISKEEFFKEIKNDKESRWKKEICQEITEKIVQRKDLDGLVIILFYYEKFKYKNIDYKDNDAFIDEIKKLGGYGEYISKYEDIKNNINIYMESVEKIAYNIVAYLQNKLDIINEKKKKNYK